MSSLRMHSPVRSPLLQPEIPTGSPGDDMVGRKIMKLYDLPRSNGKDPRPKIYGALQDSQGYIEFDHLDGMYSYCEAFTPEGTSLGICHLACFTTLEPYLDGYKTVAQDK